MARKKQKSKNLCSARCGACCEKWKYPRSYHNNPWKFIRELEEEGCDEQRGVKFIPHPKYKSYLTCAYLERDGEGLASCTIYADRPQYCRDFYCD